MDKIWLKSNLANKCANCGKKLNTDDKIHFVKIIETPNINFTNYKLYCTEACMLNDDNLIPYFSGIQKSLNEMNSTNHNRSMKTYSIIPEEIYDHISERKTKILDLLTKLKVFANIEYTLYIERNITIAKLKERLEDDD